MGLNMNCDENAQGKEVGQLSLDRSARKESFSASSTTKKKQGKKFILGGHKRK